MLFQFSVLQVYTRAYHITTVLQDIAMNAEAEPVTSSKQKRTKVPKEARVRQSSSSVRVGKTTAKKAKNKI